MGNGYWQKTLRVNLTTGDIRVEAIAEKDLKAFIGGAGLGAEILRREISEKIDPLSPENLVIFATGLLMLIPMIVTSLKGNVFADMTTKAAHHIQAKIEEIKNTHVFASGYDSPEGMTRTWTVENYGANLKKITVQMDWVDKDGLEHQNVVITFESHN